MKRFTLITILAITLFPCCKNSPRHDPSADNITPDPIYLSIGDSIPVILRNMECCWQNDSLFQMSGWDSAGDATFFARGTKTTDHQFGLFGKIDVIPCRFYFYSRRLSSLVGEGTVTIDGGAGGLLRGQIVGSLRDSTKKLYSLRYTSFAHIPNIGAEPDSLPVMAGPPPQPKHHALPTGFHPYATYRDQYMRY